VSTQTDQNNCGACGSICSQFACAGGACRKNGAVSDNGRVRLVGGNSFTNGRLEVFGNGMWGQVCDDGFNVAAANVVCRDLGFLGSSTFSSTNGLSTFLLDDLACVGTEQTLLSCPHSPLGSHNCGASEAVFVQCND
jgi:hypothetical protein